MDNESIIYYLGCLGLWVPVIFLFYGDFQVLAQNIIKKEAFEN